MLINLLTSSAGFEYVKRLFNVRIDHIDMRNVNRHMVLHLKDGRRFYCVWKREFIHSFNFEAKKLLDEYPDLRGHGESINASDCFWAKHNNCQLLFVYPTGVLYEINPRTVMAISISHVQRKENTYIKQSVSVVENELEYWFPVKLLTKFEV